MPSPRPDPAILALVLSRTRELLGMDAPSQALLSQLAAAPSQVPNSAPPAPTGGANQPASGVLPQGAYTGPPATVGSVRDLILRLSKKYRLDPLAVMAVARGEGGLDWGAVGDQGTSFGPFQLHRGGALPAGQGPEFANSPAGIEYALRKMAEAGAAGLIGPAAVEAIIRRFERPADPDSSVRNALARLTR